MEEFHRTPWSSAPPFYKALPRTRGAPTLLGGCPTWRWHRKRCTGVAPCHPPCGSACIILHYQPEPRRLRSERRRRQCCKRPPWRGRRDPDGYSSAGSTTDSMPWRLLPQDWRCSGFASACVCLC